MTTSQHDLVPKYAIRKTLVIEPQTDNEPLSSAIACIATLFSRPLNEVNTAYALHDRPQFNDTSLECAHCITTLLRHYGYLGRQILFTSDLDSYSGDIYIVRVPSLNGNTYDIPRDFHFIILDLRGLGFQVYDPEYGRSGRLWYSTDMFRLMGSLDYAVRIDHV